MPLLKEKNLIEPICLHLQIVGHQIYHNFFKISVREILECIDDEDQITDHQTNPIMTFGRAKLSPKVLITGLSFSEEILTA